jgi:hypothetical protein
MMTVLSMWLVAGMLTALPHPQNQSATAPAPPARTGVSSVTYKTSVQAGSGQQWTMKGVTISLGADGPVIVADEADWRLDTRTILFSGTVQVTAKAPLTIQSWRAESAAAGVMVFRRDVSITLAANEVDLLADEAEGVRTDAGTSVYHLTGNVRLVFPKEPVAR